MRTALFGMIAVGLAVAIAEEPRKAGTKKERAPQWSFLANDRVKVGADLALGGAIGWLSPAGSDANVVNNWDWGRQIQLSFYSGPNPYSVGEKKAPKQWAHIGWNPVQAGDDYGTTSKLIEHSNDGKVIHIKSAPMQWTLDEVPAECTFETWISLDGPSVRLKARLQNHRKDKTAYRAHTQELPAVYVNAPYNRLFTYTGDRPFENQPLKRIVKDPKDGNPSMPWVGWRTSECWAAQVDDRGFGLGVWQLGCYQFSGGFAGKPGQGGTKDSPCGYIAPNRNEHLDHNIQYDYETTLILGTLDEIREFVTQRSPKPGPPVYRFARDRQSWIRNHARDAGWPMQGEWSLSLEEPDPQLIGPAAFWKAEDGPTLYIHAAFRTAGEAQVYWSTPTDPGTSEKRTVKFQPKADGEFHVYEVRLADYPQYRGAITGLRFDPEPNGRPGDSVRIRSIGFVKPDASSP